jgi:pimeloyl-ACP methyl ester carboxylesterase
MIRVLKLSATRLASLLWALLALWLSACTNHDHRPYAGQDHGARLVPASQLPGPFDYSAATPKPITYPLPHRQLDGYLAEGIQFPSSIENGQPDNMVRARYYRSRQQPARARPLLIVLPIWDTHTYPSTTTVAGYARHSGGDAHILWPMGDNPLFDYFAIGRLESFEETEREIDLSVQRFRAAVIDLRRLLDWAETRPEIDSGRIGIIGFSMGALVGANLAGNDPRVDTAVYMVGGTRPWDIIAECQVVVGWARKRMKRALDWDQEQFRAYFHDKLAFGDPALWQGRYNAANTLIIEASEDDCMPPQSRLGLWESTGRPERIVFPYNHWQPFLAMTPVSGNVLNKDIYEFLDRKLFRSSDPPRPSVPLRSVAGPD